MCRNFFTIDDVNFFWKYGDHLYLQIQESMLAGFSVQFRYIMSGNI